MAVRLPIQHGLQNHAGIPNSVEIAIVGATSVATQKPHMDAVPASGFFHRVQWLVNVTHEMHDEL